MSVVFSGEHVHGFQQIPKGVFNPKTRLKNHSSVSFFNGLVPASLCLPSLPVIVLSFIVSQLLLPSLCFPNSQAHSYFRAFCLSLITFAPKSSHDALSANVTSWDGPSLISHSKGPPWSLSIIGVISLLRLLQAAAPTRWLKQQKSISHSSGRWEVQDQGGSWFSF